MIKVDKETKKYFQFFLETLESITDERNPGHEWFENGSHCYCEFGEMCNHFFSPYEMVVTWSILTDKQRQDLQTLDKMIDDYDEYIGNRQMTDDEIRKDPEWDKVRQFAKKVYEDLRKITLKVNC